MTDPAPQNVERTRSDLPVLILGALSIVSILVTFYMVFVFAPIERTMGVVYDIFYFHVPSAFSMYVGFTAAMVGSIGYIWKRSLFFDALAVAGAEVGLLFAAIVLTTGPMWARKAWGSWWAWDPRLTSTVLIALVFTSFVVLRSVGNAGEPEKRFAAALAIVGAMIIPIIHYSVQLWRGQHPQVINNGGLAPDMKIAFSVALVAFGFLVSFLLLVRYRFERLRQNLAELEIEAAAQGLLEE